MARRKKDDNLLGVYMSDGGMQASGGSESTVTKREMFAPDYEKLISSDDELVKIKSEDPEHGEYLEKCVRHIWMSIEENKVCLVHAVTNYDLRTGYPIYDYDTVIDLLINYGYTTDVAIIFAKELSESSWHDGTKRIVSITAAKSDIYANVEKLDDNPCI